MEAGLRYLIEGSTPEKHFNDIDPEVTLKFLEETDLCNLFFNVYNVYMINCKLAEAGLRCFYWVVSLYIDYRRGIYS